MRGATPRMIDRVSRAFSSEVDTGSREENASKYESRASVLSEALEKRAQSIPNACM
jgi:predicted ATP-grasp superfamily ATP-dependent carboligase